MNQTDDIHEEVLDRAGAARFLGYQNVRSIDYLVQSGQIPFSRISKRKLVFRKSRLLEYLAEREGVIYNRPTGKGK